MIPAWQRYLDAADDIDAILGIFGEGEVEKARRRNPLTRSGFEAVLRDVVRGLTRATHDVEQAAVERALRRLRVDWPKMGAGARERLIGDAFAEVARAGGPGGERLATAIGKLGPAVVGASKAGAAVAAKADPRKAVFNARDERVIAHAKASNALFFRDEMGRRSDALSAAARDVVAAGLDEGRGTDEIARSLAKAIPAQQALLGANYMRVIATVFTARSRTYGTLAGFEDAGIREYVFQAVLDEVTSDQCRFLHGRRFSVGRQLGRFAEVAAGDPEDVMRLQPFVQWGKDEDGTEYLYVDRGGGRQRVATVASSAFGTRDATGEFSNVASREELEDLGACTPPLHVHCRSALLPAF